MTELQINYQAATKGLIDCQIRFETAGQSELKIALSNWRPGRYEMQNFAKNICDFEVYDQDMQVLPYVKSSKSEWLIQCPNSSTVLVKYSYWAKQLDAGGSWIDPNMLYINFVNLAFYLPENIEEKYFIKIENLPENFAKISGFGLEKNSFIAENFEQLADMPFVAAKNAQSIHYQIDTYNFYVHFIGNYRANEAQIIEQFTAFSKAQIALFGSMPTPNYHFINLILNHKFYHGVEHLNNTVICLGPAEEMYLQENQQDLLGVSSHELFHAWNIKAIRPKEMLPYQYQTENYFQTGYVAEGFTTYYGDLMLFRSKVFDQKMYLKELNTLLERHQKNLGRKRRTLAESSVDLWLDGYNNLVPDRKTSIYVEGALSALVLDLSLRKQTSSTLDDLIKWLYDEFGKKNIGYTHQNIIEGLALLGIKNSEELLEKLIFKKDTHVELLEPLLEQIGLKLTKVPSENIFEKLLGISTIPHENMHKVSKIAPESPAAQLLMHDDLLVALNHTRLRFQSKLNTLCQGDEIVLHFFRNNMLEQVKLPLDEKTTYFEKIILEIANPDLFENM